MSLPSNKTRPEVGLYTPVIMLKNVVLPAPFGPDQAHDRATRDREVDVVHRDQTAELLAQSSTSSSKSASWPRFRGMADVHQRLVVNALLDLPLAPLLGNEACGRNSIAKTRIAP